MAAVAIERATALARGTRARRTVPRSGGLWLSLLGSTEGAPRDHGPPRRSARDIVNAVEPSLEIVELRGVDFDGDEASDVRGWVLMARRPRVPAQPSTARQEA